MPKPNAPGAEGRGVGTRRDAGRTASPEVGLPPLNREPHGAENDSQAPAGKADRKGGCSALNPGWQRARGAQASPAPSANSWGSPAHTGPLSWGESRGERAGGGGSFRPWVGAGRG